MRFRPAVLLDILAKSIDPVLDVGNDSRFKIPHSLLGESTREHTPLVGVFGSVYAGEGTLVAIFSGNDGVIVIRFHYICLP